MCLHRDTRVYDNNIILSSNLKYNNITCVTYCTGVVIKQYDRKITTKIRKSLLKSVLLFMSSMSVRYKYIYTYVNIYDHCAYANNAFYELSCIERYSRTREWVNDRVREILYMRTLYMRCIYI